jgi:putative component of membrane protein insertase Oxa1/YidC/SpoIIIJ protein YidD
MGNRDSVLNQWADQACARGAVLVIRAYQLTWSRLHSRTCLFRPTCSHRAIRFFRTYGFREGLHLTRHQLSECCGDYSMRLGERGTVELITRLGKVVPEDEVNPRIVARMEFARAFVLKTDGG